jgi:hypothetical protein
LKLSLPFSFCLCIFLPDSWFTLVGVRFRVYVLCFRVTFGRIYPLMDIEAGIFIP